uniref:NDUFS1a n=1 Tax=Euglena gracilis TaxID=3039 RepID=UPI002FE4FA7E
MRRVLARFGPHVPRSFHTTVSRLQEAVPASILNAPVGLQPSQTVTCWIDHILCEFQYPADITVFELARRNGINIPHFCYNRNLPIAGNCRMCMCHRVSDKKYAIACNEIAEPNAKYITVDDNLKNIRQYILEFILANHSLDCPICDQGGECDLQDLAELYGYDTSRYDYSDIKHEPDDMPINFLIKSDMNRCIHCTKCVRFLDNFSDDGKEGELGLMGRDPQTICVFRDDGNPQSYVADILSANVIEICPVGALTGRETNHETRPWEITRLDAINIFDGTLSAINVEVKEGTELYRVNASKDPQNPDMLLNNEFITDRAREAPQGNEFKRMTANYAISLDNKKLLLHHALRLYAIDPLFRSKALFLLADIMNEDRHLPETKQLGH